jgi:hypothetical protein
MGKIKKYIPECLNCANALKPMDQYCSNCGQRTQGTKVPLREFVGDFFQDYFTVDSKFFRSIFLLMIRPGRLTSQFNSGKRKSYIAPLRMYLFTSFIYFFLLSLTVKKEADSFGLISSNLEEQKAEVLDSLINSSEETVAIDVLKNRVDKLQAESSTESVISIDSEEDLSEEGLDGFLNDQVKKANKDPASMLRSLLRAASISLFFLMPLFALILWLFHFRRQGFYVPHLVHALHLHTFSFAVLSIYLLISFWVEAETFFILPIILYVYFIWSLKVVYTQKLLPSFLKSFGILFLYFILILIALVPAVMLAIATL